MQLVRLPPVMLDWLGPDYMTKEEYALRGYDLPWLPFYDDYYFSRIEYRSP